ncbi:MAG: zinc-binding dehydrogenase, partial [Alphaproteobacteria bacterium]|nr:zinc-binding dehydrogenase [Alphaproteobacteria bacterium]
ADGGTYVLAGGSVASLLQTALFGATKGKTQGKRVSLLFWRPLPADMQELAGMLAAGALRAVIDRRFKLAETDQALAWVAEGHVKGKVVVVPA